MVIKGVIHNMNILGICDSQDAGACLVKDGELVAAMNEEKRIVAYMKYLEEVENQYLNGYTNQYMEEPIGIINCRCTVEPVIEE